MVAAESAIALPPRWTPLRYHRQQSRLWNCRKRFICVPAGRRSGKTELAKRKLVLSLLDPKPWPDPRYFFGGPTEQQAKRIAWWDFKRLIPKEWIADTSESDLCIRTVFGSELWTVGLDKPQRIEGPPWDGCVLDESVDLKPHVFSRNVYPALLDRKGWCWRIGIPKRNAPSSRGFKKACERAQQRDADQWGYFHWTSDTVLPPDVIEHAKKTLDRKTYSEQLGGKWETASGLAYEDFSAERQVRTCPYNPNLPINVASDFNVDPMAWTLCHRYSDRVEAFAELWARDVRTQGMLNLLWLKYGKQQRAGFRFYGDAAARQRKTAAAKTDYQLILADPRFKKAGREVNYPLANPPVKDRLQTVNAMCYNAAGQIRLFIDPDCEKAIESMEEAALIPGTWDLVKTNDEYDCTHPSDGIGYLICYCYSIAGPFDEEETSSEEDRFNV